MKQIRFNQVKNTKLKLTRGIGFDEVAKIIKSKIFLDLIDNPNQKKYRNQKLFLIQIEGSVFVVPFVEEKDYIFFKNSLSKSKIYKEIFNQKIKS